MSAGDVFRGFSTYLRGLIVSNSASIATNSANVSALQTDMTNAQNDIGQNQTDISSNETNITSLNNLKQNDVEALLSAMVVDVQAPSGEISLGESDQYYYQWSAGDSKYKAVAGDVASAGDATRFEMIQRTGSKLYVMLEDDGGSLYIYNMTTGGRDAIDDVFDGTGNSKTDAESKAFDSGADSADYLLHWSYAPQPLNDNLTNIHLRSDNDPDLFVQQDGQSDAVAQAISNQGNRALRVREY